MLKFIITKLKYSIKLYIWLILGLIFLTGMCSMLPMVYSGSLDHLLQVKFQEEADETEKFPVVITSSGEYTPGESVEDPTTLVDWKKEFGVPVLATQKITRFVGSSYMSGYNGRGDKLDIAYTDNLKVIQTRADIDLSDNAKQDKVANIKVADDGTETADGYPVIPCAISKPTMEKYELVLGEYIKFNLLMHEGEVPFVFVIDKIVEEDGVEGYNWYKDLSEYVDCVWVDEDMVEKLAIESRARVMTFETYSLLDYRYITSGNSDAIYAKVKAINKTAASKSFSMRTNLERIIDSYNSSARSARVILYIMILPLLGLTFMFLYMLIQRITRSELREISILRSRGKKKSSVIGLYIVQNLIVSLVALVPGLIVGFGFGKAVAIVDKFMHFQICDTSDYHFSLQMVAYALITLAVANVLMIIPVIGMSDMTIIKLRTEKYKSNSKPIWEKYFVDIGLVGISAYLLYSHTEQLENISNSVILGKGMDPIIFLNASLFILSVGLLMIRLCFLVLKLLFKICKNKYSLPTYTAMLELLRSRSKTTFIFVFIVLTVALSIFHSSIARTIRDNDLERIRYSTGADIVMNEKWKLFILSPGNPHEFRFAEPEYNDVAERHPEYDFDKITRVINDDKIKIGELNTNCQLLAINTKEFGEIAQLKDGLVEPHWYNNLNDLAKVSNGAIISKSLAAERNLNIGDKFEVIRYTRVNKDEVLCRVQLKVVGIVGAWPGCDTYSYEVVDGSVQKKNRYFVVANYSYILNAGVLTPYQIWASGERNKDNEIPKVKQDANTPSYFGVKNISLASQMDEYGKRPEIKLTNSIFTLEVISALILCSIGFLIYWLTTIKERETMYGIYRAMGITSKEVNKMIRVEELVLTITATLSGVFTGILAIVLFSPLFTAIYLPEQHPIPISNSINVMDIVGILVVLVITFAICNIILWNSVKKLKVTDAVKLGED